MDNRGRVGEDDRFDVINCFVELQEQQRVIELGWYYLVVMGVNKSDIAFFGENNGKRIAWENSGKGERIGEAWSSVSDDGRPGRWQQVFSFTVSIAYPRLALLTFVLFYSCLTGKWVASLEHSLFACCSLGDNPFGIEPARNTVEHAYSHPSSCWWFGWIVREREEGRENETSLWNSIIEHNYIYSLVLSITKWCLFSKGRLFALQTV